MKKRLRRLLPILALIFLLAACSPAATAPAEDITTSDTSDSAADEVVVTQTVEGETVVEGEPADQENTPPPQPTQPAGPSTTPAPIILEDRTVVVEWPPDMFLDESDVVRLTFNPATGNVEAVIEQQGNELVQSQTQVKQITEYRTSAVATLDGIGFEISPTGEQEYVVTEGEPLTWRWTVTPVRTGRQTLSLNLAIRWSPLDDVSMIAREAVLYSRSVPIEVARTPSGSGSIGVWVTLFLGLGALFLLVRFRPRRVASQSPIQSSSPNPNLSLETPPEITLSTDEKALLRAVFRKYGRLVVVREFLSGYSGARTLLAQPIRPDGRSDAHSIVKMAGIDSMRREYKNYETFVKHTLPPVTSRIQQPPIFVRGSRAAALQYTFIGEPGATPISLRKALLASPDPKLLWKLFETFGPNWWMQRSPFTFRLAQEYDRKLPTHFVIEPVMGGGKTLDGMTAHSANRFEVGEVVSLRNFPFEETRADGKSLSLEGRPVPGHPALRVRWLAPTLPRNAAGRIIATRQTLLNDVVTDFDLHGLPDPLLRIPELLAQNVRGTRSTIHGDLNLENAMLGLGNSVWLIDFAMTREGHPLFDFAHLHAELIAHVMAPQIENPQIYLEILRDGADPLLSAIREIAHRCLADPGNPGEYALALTLSCLGALKYSNLDAHAKHLLYLTAAWEARGI